MADVAAPTAGEDHLLHEPDDRPASWTYVHAAVIAPNCATSNCHSDLAATAGADQQGVRRCLR